MQAFACPYESQICGPSSLEVSLDRLGEPSVIETNSGFDTDKVCNYKISAPEGAQDGDLIYLKIDYEKDVKIQATFGKSLIEP